MQFQEIRGATSIVTFGGLRLLVDPFLAPKGSFPPVPSPYNEFPNPLVELPLPIEQIVTVDAVIVTHMHHFDHFDGAAARLLSIAACIRAVRGRGSGYAGAWLWQCLGIVPGRHGFSPCPHIQDGCPPR